MDLAFASITCARCICNNKLFSARPVYDDSVNVTVCNRQMFGESFSVIERDI